MFINLALEPIESWSPEQGSFYSKADAARARIEHLKSIIQFWPNMAMMDAFQHWVYTYDDEAADPQACDAKCLGVVSKVGSPS